MPKGNEKGADFERMMCKKLSLWFTNDERDDVFWRTDGSGGRAKGRSKKGITTFGQYGDIQASDPLGQPLINCCCIELKTGYGSWAVNDLIDKGNKVKSHPLKLFLEQVTQDHINSHSPWYLLISRRLRCHTTVIMPRQLMSSITRECGSTDAPAIRITWKDYSLVQLDMEDFLNWVTPEFFIKNDPGDGGI